MMSSPQAQFFLPKCMNCIKQLLNVFQQYTCTDGALLLRIAVITPSLKSEPWRGQHFQQSNLRVGRTCVVM